jgi:hypothetical protein
MEQKMVVEMVGLMADQWGSLIQSECFAGYYSHKINIQFQYRHHNPEHQPEYQQFHLHLHLHHTQYLNQTYQMVRFRELPHLDCL